MFESGLYGLLLWADMTLWTYDPRKRPAHRPFILYEFQQKAVTEIYHAINWIGPDAAPHDLLIEKSRDMGASWMQLLVIYWFWQTQGFSNFLLGSIHRENVDKTGDPKCLFWKLDYIHQTQPEWIRPKLERIFLTFINRDNGAVISGEATSPNFSRSGRNNAILLDEFAIVEQSHEILLATNECGPCRLFNSTPKGMGNAFAKVRFGGECKVLSLHWVRHPEKALGLYYETTPEGKNKPHSPWYDAQCKRMGSAKGIAQELDIGYLASGGALFDLDVLQRIRGSGDLQAPWHRGEVNYELVTQSAASSYTLNGISWESESGRQRLSLWLDLEEDKNGLLRPPQDENYVAFADIGLGQGESNSVLKIFRRSDRTEVASFCDADTLPEEFAAAVVAICQWFGGQIGWVYLGWENNGPGTVFALAVYRLGYVWVLGNIDLEIHWHPEKKSGQLKTGWTSSMKSKRTLMGDLRGQLALGELTLRDEATVTELEQYIIYPNGGCGPSKLVDSPEGGRAEHGDRVIGLAGIPLCLAEMPQPTLPEETFDQFSAKGRQLARNARPVRESW